MNTPTYQLHPSRLDLWHLALSPQQPFMHQLHWLDAAEQTRFNRFYFARHKRRFAQARLAMRLILSRYLQCTPETVCFQYHARGKPFLLHASNIMFNISHSRDYALLAIGQQHELGVDVEHFTQRPFHGIAATAFSHNEQQFLQRLPATLIPMHFFSIWSRKEAFIKANGEGLHYPTQSIDLLPVQKHSPIFDPIHHQPWIIESFFPQPALAGAICYHPSIQTQTHFQL